MRTVSEDAGLQVVFDAIVSDRLSLLAGAGLSMASPSSLPSAAAIAADAKAKYSAIYGTSRAELPDAVELQAEFFFERNELATQYFRTLIDEHAFSGRPNAGHFAVADLLLVGAIQTAVTTNVDALIESAGSLLYGRIGVGIDASTVAALPPNTAPLLKIHGCHIIRKNEMVWAPGQLAVSPIRDRIDDAARWLGTRLLDRDLLIVGFWTDWDYLNAALERALEGSRPARVIVIDPLDATQFPIKAPALYELGGRASSDFIHVRVSGATFLDGLRHMFSQSYIRRVLHAGMQSFEMTKGAPASATITEPPSADNPSLWSMRRDLEGCAPQKPATHRVPPVEPNLGLTLLQLRDAGAQAEGPYWVLNGARIRVLRTPNELLHVVEARFDRETAPAVALDIVIAVGAESQSLPANIARVGTAPSIARGSAIRWLTRQDAMTELAI